MTHKGGFKKKKNSVPVRYNGSELRNRIHYKGGVGDSSLTLMSVLVGGVNRGVSKTVLSEIGEYSS